MAEVKVTKSNFEEEVMNSSLPVVIDFWATWCGPCQMIGPVLSQIAEEYEGKLKVCKVNVDEETELAAAFKVSSIPMLVTVKNGKAVETAIGYRPKEEVVELVEKVLNA